MSLTAGDVSPDQAGGDMEDLGASRFATGVFARTAEAGNKSEGASFAAELDSAPWNYSTPQVTRSASKLVFSL
jgi:hypothetical protein